MFRENYPHEVQQVTFASGYMEARYGSGPLPVEHRGGQFASSLLAYPYERSCEALERLAKDGPLHPSHGVKMRYANPVTGGHALPTISVFIQWMPKGFAGQTYCATDSVIFCAVEGRGRVVAGEARLDFEAHDVFTVPSWIPYRIETRTECVLFFYSDRGPAGDARPVPRGRPVKLRAAR